MRERDMEWARSGNTLSLVVCAGGCGSFVMLRIILATIQSAIDEHVIGCVSGILLVVLQLYCE